MKALRNRRILAALVAALAAAAASTTHAQTIVTTTWNNAIGDWGDPAQWTGTPTGYGIPNNSATASFYVAIGGGTVELYDWYTVSRLTMTGGTLGGDGILTVLGNASFANATLAGQTQTRLNGTTTQSGALVLTGGHSLVNTGAYDWIGALNLGTGTSFTNGGTVTSAGNVARTATGADATAGFANAGTFTKSGTGTTTFSGLRFENTGTVNVGAGTLSLEGGGGSTGNFTGAGTIAFRGGYSLTGGSVSTTNVVFSSDPATPNVLATGASLAGSSVTVSSGTTQINGAYAATATALRGGTAAFNADSTTGTLTLNGGTLGGTGRLSVTTAATLTTGTMTGTGLTQLLKGSTTTQTGTLTLDSSRALRNDGLYTWTGALNINNGARFENAGTVTSAGNSNRTATSATTGTGALFLNSGAFIKSGTGTTTFSSLPFLNGGTVDIQAGTLSLAGGGQSTGDFSGAGTLALRGNYQLGGGNVSVANLVLSGTAATPNLLAGSSLTSANVNFASGLTDVGPNYNAGLTTIAGTANFLAPGTRTASLNLATTGILGGTGLFTVSGASTLAGGTMTGAGLTQFLKGATTTQSGTLTLDAGRLLQNDGEYNWVGTLNVNNGAIFLNEVGGTITSAGSGNRTAATAGAASSFGFVNRGTFTKSGTGTTTFSTLPFVNMGGTVDVQAGTLSLQGGGQSNGNITGAGTLALRGNYQLGSGNVSVANLVFSGTATTPNFTSGAAITSAAVNFASGLTGIGNGYNAGATTIAGEADFLATDCQTNSLTLATTGIIGGSGIFTVTGNVTLAGGTITGGGLARLANTSTTTQSGALAVDSGRLLQNDGAYNWGGTLNVTNGAVFLNEGTVTSAGATNRTATGNNTGSVFANRGTFIKSGTGTTTFSTLPFSNMGGTVDVQAGTLSLQAGGQSNGNFTGAGTLALRGNYQLGSGSVSVANLVFSGTATTPNFASGTAITSAAVNFASGLTGIGNGYDAGATTIAGEADFLAPDARTGSLNLGTTGILGGSGLLTVTGNATITGGTMTGAGLTRLANTSTTAQSGTLALAAGRSLQNDGAFTQRGTLNFTTGAQFLNTGTYTTAGTGTRTIASADNSAPFTNTGTFVATTATTVSGMMVNNSGTVEARSGTLTFTSPVLQQNGDMLTQGNWRVGDGTSTAALAFTGNGATPIHLIAPGASVTLNGTRSTFTPINTLTINLGEFHLLNGRNFTVQSGGAFSNTGTLELGGGAVFTSAGGLINDPTGSLCGTGRIVGSVDSSGLIAPGASPGQLAITGNLTLHSGSVTQMELGGSVRSTEYDAMVISGLLAFDGTLDVTPYNGYTPAPGTSFDLFDWGSASGVFAGINLPALVNGLTWDTSQLYTSGVITAIPEPSTYAAILGALVLVVAVIRRRRMR